MTQLLRPNGEIVQLEAPPNLTEAQVLVGGYVEPVYPKKTPCVVMLVDEDGLAKKKPFNYRASVLYGGRIVGEVVVMTREEAKKGGWL